MTRFRGACVLIVSFLLLPGVFAYAQTINLDASELVPKDESRLALPKAEIFLSPRSGSFTDGSTFDGPILLNTRGSNVNAVEVRINYDKNKLSIVKPSSGKSIIGVWVEPPKYDNTKGTASYVGVVPGGITTSSGLLGTITFKVLRVGSAVVSIGSNSNVLLNDGLGTKTAVSLGRAEYSLIAKPPEGVNIFSETHSFPDEWYNNNSPIISWDKDEGVDGFSFILNNEPSTIPENTTNSTSTSQSFQDLKDGLWYLHVKASKKDVWGATGHFLLKIDTTPPAMFRPEANYLLAAVILTERVVVSFFTTDNLSGIDHYEVGVIDKSQPVTVSPVFVQTESPFQVPFNKGNSMQVVVRAVDKAGNVRDGAVDINFPSIIDRLVKENWIYISAVIILAALLGFFLRHAFVIREKKNVNYIQPPPQQS